MLRKFAFLALVSSLVVGCASVPMESKEKSSNLKTFNAPAEGKSALYVYRTTGVGTAIKKDIWVDGKCLGESAPNVFFYKEVAPGEHKISSESEFSPNDLLLKTEGGKNYFVKQYMKMGLVVGGAGLETVNEAEGKKDLAKLELAVPGKCSK
jgi:hypothetical protein